MKIKILIGCATLALTISCRKSTENPELNIYDKALERIFIQNYYGCLIEKTTETNKMDSLFWADESKREEVEDYFISLRDESIANGRTCSAHYLNALDITSHLTLEEFSKFYLQESFIKENFDSISTENIINSLYMNAAFSEVNFKSKIIKVSPYTGTKRGIRGNAIPVIGFSKILYNKSETHALLYYEHFCGVKCATGWLFYLKKENEQWQISGLEQTWIE